MLRLFLLLLCLLSAQAKADFAAGVAAYDVGKYPEAIRHWEEAARGGDLAAMRNLGHLYRQGMGTPKDLGRAAMWYQKAADAGMSRAQYNLGMLYLEGGENFPPKPEEAAVWFKKSAAQGHEAAQKQLEKLSPSKQPGPQAEAAEHPEPKPQEPKPNPEKIVEVKNLEPQAPPVQDLAANLKAPDRLFAQVGTFNSPEAAMQVWKQLSAPGNVSPLVRTLGDEDSPKSLVRLYAVGAADNMRDFCVTLRLNDLPCALQPWLGN